MTKDEYWKAHVARNPKFADEAHEIRISVGMLRKLMSEAYDKGSEHQRLVGDSIRDIFKGMDLGQFGKKGTGA